MKTSATLSGASSPLPTIPKQPSLVIGRHTIPVMLPSRRDPRLKLSAVILTIQVLGQTLLGFKLSIAQILVSIGIGAVIEASMTLRREHVLVWPASGILTGNSVALLLRASGTRHGDWWSLHGIGFFVLAVSLSLAAKYLIRPFDGHQFNPSNVGLVWTLLVVGPGHVFPQYLWWGPNTVGVTLAYVVIIIGAVWVLRPMHMIGMATSFVVIFAVLVGMLAVSGASFIAIWHGGAIRGLAYWKLVALSPEVLVFVFFMMSDPQTAPKDRRARVLYGAATALVAAVLVALQPTEFGIKLSILTSLTVVCALVPVIERCASRLQTNANRRQGVETPLRSPNLGRLTSRTRPLPAGVRKSAFLAVVIIAFAAPVDTAALATNHQVINIERGLTGTHNSQ